MSGVMAGLIGSFKAVIAATFSSLVPNGNFATTSLTGWTFNNTSTATSTADYYSSPRSLYILDQPADDPTTVRAVYSGNILTVGQVYSFSFWWKGSVYDTLQVNAKFGTNSITPTNQTGTGAWIKYSATNMVCLTNTTFVLDVNSSGSVPIYFDDLALVTGTVAP
jgi:hypothetical protein